MSEYIVDTFGIVQDFADLHGDMSTPLYQAIMDVMLSRQHEEIVRCRDCRHFNGYHGKCHRQKGGVLIDDYSTRRLEDLGDVLVLNDAEPNGYCAWGERKEGSE